MEKVKRLSFEIILFLILVLLLTAATYSRNRLWNSEIDLWIDCVGKSPHKARPHANLGFAYLNAGIYDKALEMTQRAIQIDSKFANAYYNLSIIYQKTGDLNRAIAMGKKSLEIDPDLHMAYYSLGGIYFENGQYEESAQAFRSFIKVFPYFPNAHHLLAVVYAAQKQFDRAIAEFEEELRVNPYHSLAHVNLGQVYWYEFQNRAKAIYHLKAALSLDPFLPNRREIQRLVRSLEGFS
jgi:tetratricopeptide (TPR) repeat protein